MKASLKRLKEICIEILKNFTRIIESKYEDLEHHSSRVTAYAIATAEEMGLSKYEIGVIEHAGYLHDIGKIGISESILFKPGSLDEEEWVEIKKHPGIGENVLEPCGVFQLEQPVVRHHHERPDGKGYPDGLESLEIPLAARILAVADAYDAMTSSRPYREAMEPDEAINEIKRCNGTQFDPEVVDAFLRVFEKASTKIK